MRVSVAHTVACLWEDFHMHSTIPKDENQATITVVIPAFKVKAQILDVINSIGPEVNKIIVIDDACPESSGQYVKTYVIDPRVEVIFHEANLGVGGAVKTGYERAIELEAEIVVKVDGDGQMDVGRITQITNPIARGTHDYTKGNRFFDVEAIRQMPKIRIIGNLALSFLTKLSSGNWTVFDPNNGFTAIHIDTLKKIPLQKIDSGYFFESDMLFRLNLAKAKVFDIPMPAIYNEEISNLKIRRVLFEFPIKHLRNFGKRIVYTYYLRDFNLASIQLLLGIFLGVFGSIFGLVNWAHAVQSESATPTGTVVIVAICILSSLQFLLAFFSYDMSNTNFERYEKKNF
jgi:glycosyltransferase involved in cell wall biosynthesis